MCRPFRSPVFHELPAATASCTSSKTYPLPIKLDKPKAVPFCVSEEDRTLPGLAPASAFAMKTIPAPPW